MPIQILPEPVIAQIAAGEVVERPASVVKELIENSLDAGAGTIIVEVQDGGRRLIRVSDDGSGILAGETALAVARHATSKLKIADDLATLQTLGFRGEALATIAAVSRLTLVTRHRAEQAGVEIKLEGGRSLGQRSVGVPAGTVITVENLFFNTPARLKFMKSEANERRQIANLINDYAMAYPAVRFTLTVDGRELFRSNGTGGLDEVALKVFGLDTFRQMVEVYGEEFLDGEQAVQVQGFVSLPSLHRNDRSRIALFVNGRAVHDSNIVFAITQAYHLLMEKGRYPYAVLLVQMPPDLVDVNVHPTKAEVRFQDANLVFVAVQRAVREVLMRHTRLQHRPAPTESRTPSEISTNMSVQAGFGLETPEMPLASRSTRPHASEDDFDYIPDGTERPSRPRTLPPLRVMGQIASSFVVAEGPAGLYLVDQYAASERVLFQTLLDTLPMLAQQTRTLSSITVDLTTAQSRLVQDHLDAFASLGIQLELFGVNTWKIHTVPLLTDERDAVALVSQLVLGLGEERFETNDALLRMAQVSACKTGQKLSQEQMETLLRSLERCPDPLQSPSGRATLIHMSSDQLTKEFTRRI